VDPLTDLTAKIAESGTVGVLFGFLVGVVLTLSPVSFPSLPVVMSALAPGKPDDEGGRRRRPPFEAFPTVLAFVAGMDGVIAVAGFLFVEVTVGLARASIVLHLVAAAVLGVLGARLLLRRTSVCHQVRPLPPRPLKAFFFGIAFAVGGCPACGPIAVGVGAAAALTGGPLLALATISAFVLGRALVLIGVATIGSRLLPTGKSVPWRRLDVVIGVLFLAAAGYYLFRVLTGEVTTSLPGEPGSPLLP